MTKRAVILHGTDGIPGELRWEVWLKKQLEDSGYEVFYPQLPDCHTPNLATYDAIFGHKPAAIAPSFIIFV
jgi:esterase/lipase